MKKLMTMLAAAAMAFGLYADAASDFLAGTDFDGNGNSYVNGAFVADYWSGDGASVAAVPYTATSRSSYYDKTANVNVLAVKTTLGSPVSHYLNTGKTAEKINAGLYFDAQVNFTVFDQDDTPTPAEGKLAIFLQLKGADESAGTNFVVRALGADNKVYDFVCGEADVTPGWHRLTIKSIANIYKEDAGDSLVGFVVYVDGTAVSNMETAQRPFNPANLNVSAALFNNDGQLFASLEDDDDEITSVAFDGQGQIDDIVLTYAVPEIDGVPFAGNRDGYTVIWDTAKVAAITIAGNPVEDPTAGKILLEGKPASVVISWTAKSGWVSGGNTFTIDANGKIDLTDVVKEADAEFNNVAYAFVDATNEMAKADGTLKLLKDATADLTVNRATIIDLGGNTLTGGITVEANAAAALTIADYGGKVTGNIMSLALASLTINGGTFDGSVTITMNGSITGGLFKNKPTGIFTPSPGKYWEQNSDNYWYLENKIDAAGATLALAKDVAVYEDGLQFPVETVKLADQTVLAKGTDYTIAWTPGTIAPMKAGDTDIGYTIKITFNEKYIAPTPDLMATFTVKAPAPTELPFTISWSDGITEVYYTIEGATKTAATSGQKIDVPAGKTVAVDVTPADWYRLDQPLANPYDPASTPTLTLSATEVKPDPGTPVTPTEVGIIDGAFAKDTDVSKVVTWAEANGVTVAEVNAMKFEGTLTTQEKAYLFNCAEEDVEDKEAAFKFPSITPGTVPTVNGAGNANGVLKILGADAVTGPWTEVKQDTTDTHSFYKATLSK